jgi:FkbM family methyltransferase
MLELHGYSAAFFSFVRATAADPDLLVDADLDEGSVVVDGGAYLGEWCQKVHDRYRCRVVAFEPSPTAFAELERALGGAERVELHAFGLGAHDGTAVLDDIGMGASIYETPDAPDGARSHGVEIEIRDVAAAFDDAGLDHVDLLKLNIEGAEYDVLDRLIDTGWLERIDVVSVQFHEWHPEAARRRRRIRRALATTHDETWNHPWVWERWDRRRPGAGGQKTIGTEPPG